MLDSRTIWHPRHPIRRTRRIESPPANSRSSWNISRGCGYLSPRQRGDLSHSGDPYVCRPRAVHVGRLLELPTADDVLSQLARLPAWEVEHRRKTYPNVVR